MRNAGLMAMALWAGMGPLAPAADFNGDGTGDVAVFEAISGLWAVRGVTRIYLGSVGDIPAPGDYDGSGTDQPVIFRPASGLWAGLYGRAYFGSESDDAMPGDYDGDGHDDIGIVRKSTGLWAVRDITRLYFGTALAAAISPANFIAVGGGLLETGQTVSYRFGDDGAFQKGKSPRYADLGDGTVADAVTGLMWAKNGGGAGCAYDTAKTWNEAIDWAASLDFAGYNDWRLPNRRELESLVDAGRSNPSVNPVFTNTEFYYYWSSTTVESSTSYAWFVRFDLGIVDRAEKPASFYVRAVRGGI